MKHYFSSLWQEIEGLAFPLTLSLMVLTCAVVLVQVTQSWPTARADTYTMYTSTSTASITSTTTTLSTVAPATPTALKAAPGACGSGTIVLSWPSVDTATGYRLFRDSIEIYNGANLAYSDSLAA